MQIRDVAPTQYRAMLRLSQDTADGALDRRIAELVRLRASQLNGCAYCVDMHTRDARAAGESEMRLYGIAVWQEAPFYDERERAALALTESLTRNVDHDKLDRARDEAEAVFSAEEYAALVFHIAAINAWNAISVGSRMEAGHYEAEPAVPA